jgi:hypothetical protein
VGIVEKVFNTSSSTPETIKILFIGDSHTDRASSSTTTGERPANKAVDINTLGYWSNAAYLFAEGDYLFRPDMGKSGDGSGGLLSRMDNVLTSDADVVVIMIGSNDSATGIASSKSNYTQIVNRLRENDKYRVLLVPAPHRNDYTDPTAFNAFIDELNAHAATIAATTDGVEIVPVDTVYNELMMSSKSTYGGVSSDGLHSNNRGAMVKGRQVVPYLEQFYPSVIPDKNNVISDVFVGTGGSLYSNSTGTLPNTYSGYYCNFSIVNEDGKDKIKIKTSGQPPVSYSNQSKIKIDEVSVPSGMYVTEVTMYIKNAAHITSMRLGTDTNSTVYGYSTFGTSYSATGDIFEEETEIRMRTPSTYVAEGEKIFMFLETSQMEGLDVELLIYDVKIYKVEDI